MGFQIIPSIGWLTGRLIELAGDRNGLARKLGISRPRLSNLIAELDMGLGLSEERAKIIAAHLAAGFLPPADAALLGDLLVMPRGLQAGPAAPPGDPDELQEMMERRCRQFPFLEPPLEPIHPASRIHLQEPGWMATIATGLYSYSGWGPVPQPLATAELALHTAHLAERSGSWVIMWLALQAAVSALDAPPSRRQEGLRWLHLRLQLLNAAAVLAYNLDDRRQAHYLHVRALGALDNWPRPLPRDFLWAWEGRIRCNLAFTLDSVREAEAAVAQIAEKPPAPDWHPDPQSLAHHLQIYADAALVTVALRTGATPRDLVARIRRLSEAFHDERLPPALRAAAGRKAALGLRRLGKQEETLELAAGVLDLAEAFGLASQARKTRRLFPELPAAG